MTKLVLQAPAKLNLFLHMQGRRADGYHLLESLVVFADVADTLEFRLATELSLSVRGEFAGDAGIEEENLVLKAARALLKKCNTRRGATILLTKNIPVGAGLGGGSADAAATLRGLNALWQLGLEDAALREIASTLGADVVMCLHSKPAIARGVGDEVAMIAAPLPPLFYVMAHPRVALLTKEVYDAFAALQQTDAAPEWHYPAGADAEILLAALVSTQNDLQAAAIAVSPLVKQFLQVLEAIEPRADLVRMSGSGACCFALYRDQRSAASAAANLRMDYPQWWVASGNIAGCNAA